MTDIPPAEPDRPTYRLLNDRPVCPPCGQETSERDALRTGEVAKRLADLILDSRAGSPLTLSIDGGWGAGKSTLMRQIQHQLEGKDPKTVECLWFNAWTARGGDALEGLIKSVLRQFDRNVLRRAYHRAREYRTAVRLLRGTVTLAFGFFHVGNLVDRLWEQWEVDAASRNELRNVMRDLTDDWADTNGTGRPGRLLVVFVDDLDRCSDETVHAVLDAIKVYLNLPGLVFVLGFDQSRLIRRTPGPNPPGGRPELGVGYLEKIVQAGYRMPPPEQERADEMVLAYAREAGLERLLLPHLARLLADRTGRNPRRIKRLINSFVMYQLDPEWQRYEHATVLRTVLLHHLYPEFHRAVSTPGVGDLIEHFVQYHRGRTLLERTAPDLADPAWDGLERLAARLDVEPPRRDDPAGRSKALARMERRLPDVCRELLNDPDFVRLVTELYEAPDSQALRLRYQRTAPPSPAPATPPDGPDGADDADGPDGPGLAAA